MDVEKIPTVEELTPWMGLDVQALAAAEKLAADAYDLRQFVATIYTSRPLGFYLHSEKQAVGLYAPVDASLLDVSLAKQAAERFAPVCDLSAEDLVDGSWVKAAFTPAIRGIGSALGFFPTFNDQGVQTSDPSVYRSMLTSGLLGAGLGYGIGTAGEWMLPRRWRKGRLRNTLAMMGGAAGAAPGALWGLSNVMTGRSFGDPKVLNTHPDAVPQSRPEDFAPFHQAFENAVKTFADKFEPLLKEAFESEGLGSPLPGAPDPLAVNIDYLGRTLWQTGATPQTAGMTLGTLGAAQQMPGGSRPGWVTPAQMGNLAAHMGAGWLSGALVGTVLGALTGMPESAQNKLKQTGMYLGVVKSVMPAMFGG